MIPDGPATPFPSKAPASSGGGAAAVPGAPASPSPEGAAPGAAEPEPIGTEPTGNETDPQAAQPLTLDGKTFKTHAEAENFVKAQNGRVKALTGRIGEYASSANAWMEYARTQEAEANRLRGGAQPSSAPGNAPTSTPESTASRPADPNQWIDGLDWQFYGQLAKEQGPEYAGYWLAQRIAERQDAILNERLDARFKPYEENTAIETTVRQTHGFFDAVASRGDESGTPLYPELLEGTPPEVWKGVMDIWATLPPEIQLSERGVVLAIAEYRLQHGNPPRRAAAGTASGASVPVLESIRQAQAAGAQTLTGDGTPRPAANPRAGAEADFRRQIREAGNPKVGDGDTRLGFYD